MKLNYITFLRKLIIFTIICSFIGFGIVYFLPPEFITPTLPYLFLFFFSITTLVHFILLKVSQNKATNFINIFMLLTFGKLMLFLSIILIYIFLYRNDAVPFVITFFILYVVYTTFEVVQSLAHNKSQIEATQKKEG